MKSSTEMQRLEGLTDASSRFWFIADNADNADNAGNAGNAGSAGNADNAENAENAEKADNWHLTSIS